FSPQEFFSPATVQLPPNRSRDRRFSILDSEFLIQPVRQILPFPVAERVRVCRRERCSRKTRWCRANVGAARFAPAGGQARVTEPVRARPNRARTRGKYRVFSARVSAPADARRSSADFRFRVF